MKKHIGLALGFCLSLTLLSVSSVSSAAPQIVGSKCVKAGSFRTAKNVRYQCKKSSKGLRWVITSMKSANPTSTTTTTSSTTTTTSTIPPLPWQRLRAKLLEQVESRTSSGRELDFQFHLSPTLSASKATETMNAYRRASRYWTTHFSTRDTNPIVWTLLTEKDYDWWYTKVKELHGPSADHPWNPTTNIFGHCGLNTQAYCGYGNFENALSGQKTFFQYNVIGSNYSRTPEPNVVAHESVHFYQFSITKGLPSDLPCWFIEGQATLYGNVFSSVPRESDLRRVRTSIGDSGTRTATDWSRLLEQFRSQPSECYREDRHYFLGSLIWEFLLIQYSEEALHRVLVEMNSTNWTGAIQKHLGVNQQQLDQGIAQYLESVFG